MYDSMPKGAADKLKEELKTSGSPSVDTLKGFMKSDFADRPGVDFSPADMVAMFTLPKKDLGAMMPYVRKVYASLGKIIEDYEKSSSDNSGEGGE